MDDTSLVVDITIVFDQNTVTEFSKDFCLVDQAQDVLFRPAFFQQALYLRERRIGAPDRIRNKFECYGNGIRRDDCWYVGCHIVISWSIWSLGIQGIQPEPMHQCRVSSARE